MKYYAVLPIRRDWIIDTGEMFVLALADEENLRRCLHLIGRERQIHALQEEIARIGAKLEELELATANLKSGIIKS